MPGSAPRGGDANNALTLMLTCSQQSVPKVAYVFDEDVDIYDPDRVQWAFAFRDNPERGTTILPRQNANALDPSLTTFTPPFHVSKIGFDCTIPLDKEVHRWAYAVAEMVPPLDQSRPSEMSEEDLAGDMERFIKERPRAWIEIVKNYAGQPYPVLYRAFGRLRPRLGRLVDEAPYFPYVLLDKEMIHGKTAEEFMKENGSQ